MILQNTLATLYKHLNSNVGITLQGNTDVVLSDISYDSRNIEKDMLFFALPGIHSDGAKYIESAIQKGAAGIVTCAPRDVLDKMLSQEILSRVGIVHVMPEIIRKLMAELSAIFFNYPAEKLSIIGVTGTDGKSTTVSFIHQLLKKQGLRTGFWSTVQSFDGLDFCDNTARQTTPESPDLHRVMRKMCDNECSHAILEVSSHALSHKTLRVHGIYFDVAVLTNIDSEHLEFHGSIEQYVLDKSHLFSQIADNGTAVIRKDEPYLQLFTRAITATNVMIQTHSIRDKTANFSLQEIESEINYSRAQLYFNDTHIKQVQLNCAGEYNLENALSASVASYAACKHSPFLLENIVSHFPNLIPPQGRMHTIEKEGVTIIVDYAHTPGSFRTILPMLQKLLFNDKKQKTGRLIVVFGSAGERDVQKRSVQGEIADEYADIIILTDEDPRGEDALKILQAIASGCGNKNVKRVENENLFLITNRKEAIQKACDIAESGDIVVCLGKGHEKSIEYSDYILDWNEIEVAKECLNKALNIS